MRKIASIVLLGLLILSVPAGPALAASGDLLWTRRWDSSVHRDDTVVDMAIDPWGNMYVCGWTDKGSGSTIDHDVLLVKYSPTGAKLWTKTWNSGGINSWELGMAVACDSAGNAYVTGSSNDLGWDKMILLKYNPGGVLQWATAYNPHNADCQGSDIVVTPAGDFVCVVGRTLQGPGLPAQMITFKHRASDGAFLWLNEYAGPTPSASDGGEAIRLDSAGNVYVCGSVSSSTERDLAVVKYDPNSIQLWARRFDGTAHDSDQAQGLALDGSNNAYVTGTMLDAGRGTDSVLIKVGPTGGLKWLRRYDGPTHGNDMGRAIALSKGRGMIAVTGQSATFGGAAGQLTLRYDLNGALLWARRETASAFGDSVWIGPGGNVYTAGESLSAATGPDFATIKYSPLGTRRWFRRYNRSIHEGDAGRCVIANSSGCYVTGMSYSGGPSEHEDVATLKYVP